MATVKYVQTRDPDTGQLSPKHLLEVTAENVIFEEENMTLPQKMETKSDKTIYGDDKISKGRYDNSTEGEGSLAFGNNVQAKNANSTAFGNHTIVDSAEGVVTGRYNLVDEEQRYAFIIGNGTVNEATGFPERSNAFSVDWNGNVYANKFLDLDGQEAITTLKSIQVGNEEYALHGTKLHLVAGHNIILKPTEIESPNIDGSTSHTLQVTIIADKNAAGDGTGGGGIDDGLHLPLIGGTEYGPVIFNTAYDRTKFTDAEKEAFIKTSPQYKEDMTPEQKEQLLRTMSYMPIVIGDPTALHLNIDCNLLTNPSLDSYNEKTKQGGNLFLNKSKGIVIIGGSLGNGIVWNPKKRNGGTGLSVTSAGTAAFGWGSGVLPTGQNSIALGANTRAGGSSAFAAGDSARASGIAAFAEGMHTSAAATAAHAEGSYTYVKGANSHAEGHGNVVLGLYSHIEGYGDNSIISSEFTIKNDKEIIKKSWQQEKFTLLYGDYSHLEGKNNLGLGNTSHIEGEEQLSLGNNSHTEGIGHYEDGFAIHLEGGYHYATGRYNHTEGFGNKNKGNYSFVSGYVNLSSGDMNFITGDYDNVIGERNIVFGSNNFLKTNKIFLYGEKNKIKSSSSIYSIIYGTDNSTDIDYPKLPYNFGAFIYGSNNRIKTEVLLSQSLYNIKDSKIYLNNDISLITGKNLIIKNTNETSFILGTEISLEKELNIKSSIIGGKNFHGINGIIENSIIYGENNNIQGENEINSTSSTTLNSLIIGQSNQFFILQDSFVTGSNNYLNSAHGVTVKGDNNHIENSSNSFITGINNTVVAADTAFIQGYNNYIQLNNGGHSIFIEGQYNKIKLNQFNSSNFCVHIEGYENTIAFNSSEGTHIEGYHNAAGKKGHVEGQENYGGGILNHIEGEYNTSVDLFNFELGYDDNNLQPIKITTYLSYDATANHMEGRGSFALGSYAHIEGGTTLTKNDIQNIKENYFIKGISSSYTLLLKQLENWQLHISLGNFEHLEGRNNFTNTENGHTEGRYNINLMNDSHIIGNNNVSYSEDGRYYKGSLIEGYQNTIISSAFSHIEGKSDLQIGYTFIKDNFTYTISDLISKWKISPYSLILYSDFSHLEGVNNIILHSNGVHVEGKNNFIYNSTSSHSEGNNIINYGTYTHAEGMSLHYPSDLTEISFEDWQYQSFSFIAGNGGHLEGFECWCDVDYGHVEGYVNAVTDFYGHAEGKGNISSGLAAHVEGISNSTQGKGAHAEGENNTAQGDFSHAQGNTTVAIGNYSFTAGKSNQAIGDYSIAFGKNSISKSEYSITLGEGLIASSNYQITLGKYNKEDTSSLIVIGNGKSDENRQNVVEVTRDGFIRASGFQRLDGSAITGGGSEIPVGTIITNQNENESGFDYGKWEFLGKQNLNLIKNDSLVEVNICYWKRIEEYEPPQDDEIYTIIGSEVPEDETFSIIGSEVPYEETFIVEKKEDKK